ncbi:carcinoembryonic antigen-related cell adhesion molecule 5-like, partial [Clarias magur]
LTGRIHFTQTAEKPKPELTSDHKGDLLTGNPMTLICKLKLQSNGWKFYWSTPTQSTETETAAHYYFYLYYYSYYYISSVSVSYGGQYRCRAGRGNPVYYTHYSDALWVNVNKSPKPVVIIKPDTQVFRGETVTFRCDIQTGGDTEWTYSWYKNNNTQLKDTTQEIIVRPVTGYYDGSKYTCRGRRRDSQLSQISDAVTLSVSAKPRPTVRVSPQSSIYTGDRVTLSCDLPSTGWNILWYKGYQQAKYQKTVDTDSYTLNVASFNEEHYHCKARRGNYESKHSDPATITVK